MTCYPQTHILLVSYLYFNCLCACIPDKRGEMFAELPLSSSLCNVIVYFIGLCLIASYTLQHCYTDLSSQTKLLMTQIPQASKGKFCYLSL